MGKSALAKSSPYKRWEAMKQRCTNPNDQGWHRYGGRGIRVCDRWLNSFQAFLADMGPPPPGTTLDRIDNSGHYCPENCRWATPTEQARNRRTSRVVVAAGQSKTLAEWAQLTGLPTSTIQNRLNRGVPPELALELS